MQIPFCVVVGWFMGQPMDLNFKLFETATLFITVLVVAFMLQVSPCLSFTNFMVFMLIFVVVSDAYIYIYISIRNPPILCFRFVDSASNNWFLLDAGRNIKLF